MRVSKLLRGLTFHSNADTAVGTLYESQVLASLARKNLGFCTNLGKFRRSSKYDFDIAVRRVVTAMDWINFTPPDKKTPQQYAWSGLSSDVKPDALVLAGNELPSLLAEHCVEALEMKWCKGTFVPTTMTAAQLRNYVPSSTSLQPLALLEITKGPSEWKKKMVQHEKSLSVIASLRSSDFENDNFKAQCQDHRRLLVIAVNESKDAFDDMTKEVKEIYTRVQKEQWSEDYPRCFCNSTRVLFCFAPFRNIFSEITDVNEKMDELATEVHELATEVQANRKQMDKNHQELLALLAPEKVKQSQTSPP